MPEALMLLSGVHIKYGKSANSDQELTRSLILKSAKRRPCQSWREPILELPGDIYNSATNLCMDQEGWKAKIVLASFQNVKDSDDFPSVYTASKRLTQILSAGDKYKSNENTANIHAETTSFELR